MRASTDRVYFCVKKSARERKTVRVSKRERKDNEINTNSNLKKAKTVKYDHI